jgi:hypothetical protein
MGDMQGPGWTITQAGRRQSLQPDLAAPQSHLVHRAGWLTDRPDHSEVTYRSAGCLIGPFEKNHAFTGARKYISLRQAQHPSTYHCDVGPFLHEVPA